MNPSDAARVGVASGEWVRVTSKAGGLDAQVEISDEMREGVVSFPHGWGHERAGWRRATAAPAANVNLLASAQPEDLEAVSGSSHLDGISVEIARVARQSVWRESDNLDERSLMY